ncbi:acyl-CoA dehydrogenase N-terminal domain-containing protein, partial [Nocardia rhizosphaerihabitans]|uniref:acyl-CoA dehydrogenase N-terminal domain-containing protein n=1 Tax=Nocardia rhizosphaerihabitans TaxID=1691570 RepID=UPI00367069C9
MRNHGFRGAHRAVQHPPGTGRVQSRGDGPVGHYKSNVRDLEFNLFEVYGL